MEKEVKALKKTMRNNLKKQRVRLRMEMQKAKVRFSSHTTNVYHSTVIHPRDVLMSSGYLPKFTSL